MATQIQLPTCLADALKELFPTLDWSRITFFIGIKWPFSYGDEAAITLPSKHSSIHIYINEDHYAPCTRDFFTLVAHELVHALQIQESFAGGKGLGHINMFSFKYFTCYLKEYSADEYDENKYEDEAYRYQKYLDQAIDSALAAGDDPLPCDCSTIPFAVPNPNFMGVSALASKAKVIIKRKAESKGFCRARVMSLGIGSGMAAEGNSMFGWLLLGAAIGASIGGLAGAFIGAMIGMIIGIIDWASGVPSGIVTFALIVLATLLDGIRAVFSSLVDWISPGDRPLNLIFSTDNGATFADPVSVGTTGEPPALAFSPTQLFIGWVSSENDLNLVSLPNSPDRQHKKWGWSSDDSGPALTWDGSRLFLIWQRKKNRLVSRTSTDAWNFTSRVRIGGKVPDDATPGVAFGNSRAFVAWIRKKNHKIGFKSSATAGATWTHNETLRFRSRSQGSAALAFGAGKLYLAWATKKRQILHIATLSASSSGAISIERNLKLDVRCKKKSGPALAFGNSRLFIAWVGRGHQRLNVTTFDVANDGQLTQSRTTRLSQRAKKNAGPALAYGMGNLVLAWVRKNR